MNKNVAGFGAGLGIFVLCLLISYSNPDSITDILCNANVGGGDCGNAGLFAFICIPPIAIIAGVIGWRVVTWWLSRKKEPAEDTT